MQHSAQLHIQHLRVWLYLAFFILAVMHEYNERSICGTTHPTPRICTYSDIQSMRVWQIWAHDNMEKGNTWQWGRGWCWFSQAQSMRAIIPPYHTILGSYHPTRLVMSCYLHTLYYRHGGLPVLVRNKKLFQHWRHWVWFIVRFWKPLWNQSSQDNWQKYMPRRFCTRF